MAYKYCEETTISQPLYYSNSACVITLEDIVKQEKGEIISNKSKVINLDAVARSNHPHQTPSTMDIAFCISERNKHNAKEKIVNGRWCLVELKYDVDSAKSLKKKDIEKKVTGSKDLIGNNIPCHNKYYFIFSKKQLGRSILNRISSGKPNSPYVPFDTKDLLQEFF